MNAESLLIRKEITLHPSPERIWEVLFQDHYTRQWYAAFQEGAHAVTDWQVGSKALFQDNDGNGMIGTIVESIPNEVLSIEYVGLIMNGEEDYESPGAQAVKGGRETYRLNEKGGTTQLEVNLDISPDYYEMMASAWDQALIIIKELAESKA